MVQNKNQHRDRMVPEDFGSNTRVNQILDVMSGSPVYDLSFSDSGGPPAAVAVSSGYSDTYSDIYRE